MNKEITLKDLYLGRADGSQEAEEYNFENFFYRGNNKYDLLNDDSSKFIISGRKGTGKTILAKYFEKEKNKEGIPTRILNKRELVLKMYLEKGRHELDRKETELFIEYSLLCEMANILLDEKQKFFKLGNLFRAYYIYKNIKILENLVEKRFYGDNFKMDSFTTKTENEKNQQEKIGIKSCSETVAIRNSGTVDESYSQTPYFQIMNRIKKSLFYLMDIVPVNLIFDDLDELDEKIDGNESLIKFLIDFLEVANALNNQIRNKKIKKSRVIILIRSDIIKILNENSSNLNKIIADSEIRLNWIKIDRSCEMHPLMELIVTKIKKSNSALKDLSNKEIMKRFFPEKINGIPVISHMLNCSYGRPRDIINMLNIIKNEYPNKKYFNADLFKDTHQEYSNRFTDELRNELSTHYEQRVIEECFQIIHYIDKKSFWISDIENALNEKAEKLSYFKTKEQFADFAYKHGIIGNIWEVEGMNKKKNKFSWKYREDGSDMPDYNKKFALHLGLRKTLLR